MRLGLAIPIDPLGLAASVSLAQQAEELGYDSVWTSEVAAADGFTPLAAIAATTKQLRLGLALAPVFTRPPALLAMSAAGMQAVSDGRFVLGVGSSSKVVVERWMGVPHDRPLTRVRETVEALRLILTGEKTNYEGKTFSVHDFRLTGGGLWLPIMLGALGPKMYRLAGEISDGVLATFVSAEALPALLENFAEGALESGRDVGKLEVICRVSVAVDEDDEALRAMLRLFIAGYGTVPMYNALIARMGFEAEAAEMAAAWSEGRRPDAVAAVSEKLLHALVAFGSAGDCIERLREYERAGTTTVVVAPVSAAADPVERLRRIQRGIELIGESLR